MKKSLIVILLQLLFYFSCTDNEKGTLNPSGNSYPSTTDVLYNPGLTTNLPLKYSRTENFVQKKYGLGGKADILWVIDNSASMETEQNNVSENIKYLIDELNNGNVDFNIAIISTDTDENGYFRGGIFSKNTSELISELQKALKLGINGNPFEKGLTTAKLALEKAKKNESPNVNFLRENANFLIIILSDEDDLTLGTNNKGPTGDRNSEIAYLLNVKKNPELVNISGIIADGSPDCYLSDWILEEYQVTIHDIERVGYFYMEAARKSGGLIFPICAPVTAYSGMLTSFGIQASGAQVAFYLTEIPDPNSIEVLVNGQPAVRNALEGWEYSSVMNYIIFNGKSVPQSEAKIVVNYNPKR